MNDRRHLTIKPSCMREIAAFPPDRAGLLWDKINQLAIDPLPDGKVKKKLKGSDGIYRLRVAEHRVFYGFSDRWVNLLGIRRRSEDTYDSVPDAVRLTSLPDDDDDLGTFLARLPAPSFNFAQTPSSRPLPRPLTPEFLRGLGVATSAMPVLLRCRTEDDLLVAAIPADVLAIVLDALFPPTLETLVRQPDLVVPSTEHLIRFKEGDLVGFLLHLDDEQRRLTRWALAGPTMVRGGAGTGKSTIALYRVKELLERPGASGRERVLFTTYTRALLTVTRQLLAKILKPDQLRRVTVATCDQVALEIVSSQRRVGEIESDRDALRRLAALRKRHKPTGVSAFEARLRERALERLSDLWLLEEFDWILDGRGLATLDEYLHALRPGRGLALNPRARAAVWDLHAAFTASAPGERFPALRREALAAARSAWRNRYDAVLVDEAQDLSPVSLALLAEVCATPEGLFFAADSKQSLYSRNYSWSSAHPRLQFRGRTALLRRNYRSTWELDRAAFAVLQPDHDEPMEPSTSVHEGPLPVLVRGAAAEDEGTWVAGFIRQMARHLHLKVSAAAVLAPTAAAGELLAEQLQAEGLDARFFSGRQLDLRDDVVRVLTLHSAKGLEFPVVAVAGLASADYPVPEDFDDPELFAERARHERRLLHVGLTRAMRGLMLLVPKDCRHPALQDLDPAHWHLEEVR